MSKTYDLPELDVKRRAIKQLDEREREFLLDMLSGTDCAGVNDLDDLRKAYEEKYEEIWVDSNDGLAADNERHEADDYYTGYVAGASMVLQILHEVFEITPG